MSAEKIPREQAAKKHSAPKPPPKGWNGLIEAVELKSVTADEVYCFIDRDWLLARKGKKLKATPNLSSEEPSKAGDELSFRFRLEVAVSNEAQSNDKDAKRTVFVGLVYRAAYVLARDFKTTKPLLKAFRDRVALMHVLPFMRAHVVDLTARAGLSPLVLPLMKRGGLDHG